MTAREIIERLARERVVEQMIANICRRPDLPEMADFAQMVYLALLTKPSDKIERAYEEGWLPFMIVRIIRNNWFTNHSAFRDLFRKYQLRAAELDENMRVYEQDPFDRPSRERGGGDI